MDLYQVLGVHPNATVEQIKAAYRRKALQYHPDKNDSPAAAELFKQCTEAYGVLSDPPRRTRFDREQRGVSRLAREMIQDLLGGRRRRRHDGRDLRYTLQVSFEEAALGAERRICFPVIEECTACGGVGAAPGGTRPCPMCEGRGEAHEKIGPLSLPYPCGRCGGQGIAIAKGCDVCGGIGSREQLHEYSVRLHAGVKDGEVKVVRGEGEPGRGGAAAGDLHIVVRVTPHALLSADGVDLRVRAPLSVALAALGGELEVPTLEGRARMKIPAGTPSGRVFRLAGKGLPHGATRGDLLVEVEVEVPVMLGERERQLLDQLERALTDEQLPRRGAFRAALAPSDAGERR